LFRNCLGVNGHVLRNRDLSQSLTVKTTLAQFQETVLKEVRENTLRSVKKFNRNPESKLKVTAKQMARVNSEDKFAGFYFIDASMIMCDIFMLLLDRDDVSKELLDWWNRGVPRSFLEDPLKKIWQELH
jgi:hypothetical protein